MIASISEKLGQVASEPIGLVFAFALGLASAASSACCTLPALGLIVGYTGTRTPDRRRDAVMSAVYFTIGLILALVVLGGVAGFVGQVAQASLGRYWRAFAGLAAIVLGLSTIGYLPFDLSFGKTDALIGRIGSLGSALAGLLLGGVVAATSMPCSPGIFIVMGAAILQGAVVRASLLLGMYAIGFAIPLGLVMLGVSMGRVTLAARGAESVMRWAAGLVLIVAGFYFLLKL